MSNYFKFFESTGNFATPHHSKCTINECFTSGPSLISAETPQGPFALLHNDKASDFAPASGDEYFGNFDEYLLSGSYLPIDDWYSTRDDLSSLDANAIFISTANFALSKDLRPLFSTIHALGKLKQFFLVDFAAEVGQTWSRFCAESTSEILTQFGLTLSKRLDSIRTFDVFQITASPSFAESFLSAANLNPSFLQERRLYLTTEDADLERAGGIGTYIKTLRKIRDSSPGVLYLGSSKRGGSRDTLHWQDVFPEMSHQRLVQGPHLVELVRGLSVLMPHLESIEVQDAGALGFRLIQAKNSGGLPFGISVDLFMHGGTDHVKFGIQNQVESSYSFDDLRNSTQEYFAAKHADSVTSPSSFLAQELQSEFGYTFKNLRISKLPYSEPWPKPSESFGKISEITFVGKFSRLKGWNDFLDAIREANKAGALDGIQKISAFGSGSPSADEIEALEEIAQFEFDFLTHDEFLKMVAQRRDSSLFVLPQRGENYPLTTLEMVLYGARFLGFDAGGASEIVGLAEEGFLVKPDSKKLASAIASQIVEAPLKSQIARAELQKKAAGLQREVNETFSHISSSETANKIRIGRKDLSLAVATPVFRTPLELLSELANSLKKSSFLPAKWCLIDEGSDENYTRELKGWVTELNFPVPVDVIRQQQIGLAGARNTGLIEMTEDLIYFMDGDDLFLPGTLAEAKYALEHFPALCAVAGFTYDLDHWKKYKGRDGKNPQSPNWMPLGIPEARSIALARNEFIPASSCVRRETVLTYGGWDGTDRSAWEDWAFYSKLAWQGLDFSILPHSGYLYRDTPGSMSKTLNNYFGLRRLVRNLPGFTKHDANVLLSFAQNPLVTSGSSAPQHFVLAVLEKFINENANKWLGKFYRQIVNLVPKSFIRKAANWFEN